MAECYILNTHLELHYLIIAIVNQMLFCFMPEKGTIDVVLILEAVHEECHLKGKSCICVLWTW